MDRDPAARLFDAMADRDYDAIAACFAPGARLRALVPKALRDDEGPAAIAERFRFWWGELEDFELAETETEPVEDRVRIRFRVRARDPEDGWVVQEQSGYLTAADGLVTALNTVCSGFRPAGPKR